MKHFQNRFVVWGFVIALMVANNAFSQIAAKAQFGQNPVAVEIANQPGSPLLVSLVNVDTTDKEFQKINLIIQSLSEKPVRGYVLLTEGVETKFFPAEPFLQGRVDDHQIIIRRENIRSDNFKLTIVVDYVAYTDGTGWGEDNEHKSDSIFGQTSGARSAATDIAALIKSSGLGGVKQLLAKPAAEVVVPPPPDAEGRSEDWLHGYRTGYRGFIHLIRSRYEDSDFLVRLDEARRNLD